MAHELATSVIPLRHPADDWGDWASSSSSDPHAAASGLADARPRHVARRVAHSPRIRRQPAPHDRRVIAGASVARVVSFYRRLWRYDVQDTSLPI